MALNFQLWDQRTRQAGTGSVQKEASQSEWLPAEPLELDGEEGCMLHECHTLEHT